MKNKTRSTFAPSIAIAGLFASTLVSVTVWSQQSGNSPRDYDQPKKETSGSPAAGEIGEEKYQSNNGGGPTNGSATKDDGRHSDGDSVDYNKPASDQSREIYNPRPDGSHPDRPVPIELPPKQVDPSTRLNHVE